MSSKLISLYRYDIIYTSFGIKVYGPTRPPCAEANISLHEGGADG